MEAVGERGEDFEGFAGNFLLFSWRKGAKSTEIMEAVGEFDDEDADILSGCNKKLE